MNLVVCPHCNSHRIVTSKLPKEVVAVMSCPACSELVVLFRKKVIALDRRILEEGTMEERKNHIASVIAEFLEPGMFPFPSAGGEDGGGPINFEGLPFEALGGGAEPSPGRSAPITDREQDHFARIQLQRLDDSVYFKRHFG